ncbi:MAG: hypothetical protein QNK37_07315 [Acidobacteriota bacterium]|nr:hypothetical protein [Acidobacteriota bacterium]
MENPVITDIWFRTGMHLMRLGQALNLRRIRHDYEDYWEWITGIYGDVTLDITRTHTLEPEDTDTRIFVQFGPKIFTDADCRSLAAGLTAQGIESVSLGRWVYLKGNDFEKQVVRTVHKS